MSYRYEWDWQWQAERISLTDISTSNLLKEIESKVRSQLGAQAQVTGIESITHEGVQHWTELGIKRRYSGTTKTVFLSTVKSGSPIDPVIIAIISTVLTLIVYAIIAFIVYTVASVVKEIVAPTAGGIPTIYIIVAGVLGYAWLTGGKK